KSGIIIPPKLSRNLREPYNSFGMSRSSVSDEDTDAGEFSPPASPSPLFSSPESSIDQFHHSPRPIRGSRSLSSTMGARGSSSGAPRGMRFFDFDMPGNGEFTFEDKVLQTNALVKLSSKAIIGSSESMISGTDWTLSGKVCVRCESTSYYNVLLTMQPSTDHKNVQMTVCIQYCPSRTGRGSGMNTNIGQIKNCDVTMKFLGNFGVAFVKHIQVEKHGFCRGLNHSYGEEVTSATNSNFHPLEPMRVLCQTTEIPYGLHHPADFMEFIPVEVDISMQLKVMVGSSECEEKNTCENYSFRLLSKRKSSGSGCDMWTKKLRTDDSFADVTFKVGPDLSHDFKAHKCVLAARSPVFRAMFQADMKEKNSGEIELTDVDPSTMNSFLHLLYETEGQNIFCDPKVVLEVLEVAHKYQIQEIIDSCTQSLVSMTSDKFDIKTALDVFSVAHRFSISDLEFKALQSFMQNKDELASPAGKAAVRDFMKEQYELSPALLNGLFSN
ncbi:unnamed protein product, partial [Allacma fusca]